MKIHQLSFVFLIMLRSPPVKKKVKNQQTMLRHSGKLAFPGNCKRGNCPRAPEWVGQAKSEKK
jgi:hypothetical protein